MGCALGGWVPLCGAHGELELELELELRVLEG